MGMSGMNTLRMSSALGIEICMCAMGMICMCAMGMEIVRATFPDRGGMGGKMGISMGKSLPQF